MIFKLGLEEAWQVKEEHEPGHRDGNTWCRFIWCQISLWWAGRRFGSIHKCLLTHLCIKHHTKQWKYRNEKDEVLSHLFELLIFLSSLMYVWNIHSNKLLVDFLLLTYLLLQGPSQVLRGVERIIIFPPQRRQSQRGEIHFCWPSVGKLFPPCSSPPSLCLGVACLCWWNHTVHFWKSSVPAMAKVKATRRILRMLPS